MKRPLFMPLPQEAGNSNAPQSLVTHYTLYQLFTSCFATTKHLSYTYSKILIPLFKG